MHFGRRVLALIMSICCALSLVACNKTEEVDEAQIVYEYGDSVITYGEFYIYAKTVEEDYRKAYGNGIWSLELSTDEGKSSVKDVTIRDLVYNINRIKVLVEKAEDMEIALNEKETAEAADVAAAFFAGLTEEDIKETEITQKLARQVIEENMLAEKVYNQTIAEHEFEISEEQARMTTFCDMVFECYRANQDGTVEEYTEEKKAIQLEKANEALSALAQDEEMTYEMIVDKYDLKYAATYTMSRTELIEEYGESVTDKILALSDGEVSVVIESEYGYHIFKMLQAKDEELTKKNKASIIENMQKEYFNGVYEDWAKKYDSRFHFDEDVNQELVGKFPFTDGE